jgi:hypothetical protein
MFRALWRRLWNGDRVIPANPRRTYRPWLESLEDRALPALSGGGLIAPPVSCAFRLPLQGIGQLPGGTAPIQVTVAENAPATVIDLGPVFASVRGLQYQDGLRLSVLGNTNSALVRTELSDSALTLSYTRGRCGTAAIAVCATDADGVSVQQTLMVTVRPLTPVGIGPMPGSPPPSAPLATWR